MIKIVASGVDGWTVRCEVHQLDLPDDVCQHCGGSFCTPCMVYPSGERRPGVCRRCALTVAGVRKRQRARGVRPWTYRRRRKTLRTERAKRPAVLGYGLEQLGIEPGDWSDAGTDDAAA